tara:strand:- start:46 stop:1230 length:1185 start_codon:yes stop_codon:yes gene_type:complete
VSDIGLSDAGQSDIASSGLSSGMPDMGSDYDTASFDEAYDTDDFTQEERDFASAIGAQTGGFGDDNTAQTIANFLAQPQLGLNRSNIIGSRNFDPTFAAALDISRGLNPGVGSPLVRPSYLSPQVPGEFMTTPFGEADMVRPMFFSQGEKFLQQTLPEIVRSGPMARIATGIGNFFTDLFTEGKEFAKDATAGIKLPSLQDISEGFTNFVDRFRPRETDTNPRNMLEAAVRDEVPRFNYGNIPSGFTFGSMPNMNTGIVSVDPRAARNANVNVAEAIQDLQLVPSEDSRIIGNRNASINMRRQAGESVSDIVKSFQSPINKVEITDPAGVFSALPTERDREKRDFARDIFEAFPDQRTRQFGPKDRLASINEEYFNRVKNKQPFVDTGNFIVLD